MLVGAICGKCLPEGWVDGRDDVSPFDAKADIEAVLVSVDAPGDFSFMPGGHPALYSGQTVRIEREGQLVGYLGALYPELTKKFDLE